MGEVALFVDRLVGKLNASIKSIFSKSSGSYFSNQENYSNFIFHSNYFYFLATFQDSFQIFKSNLLNPNLPFRVSHNMQKEYKNILLISIFNSGSERELGYLSQSAFYFLCKRERVYISARRSRFYYNI